jgi:hypothetical protein
MRLPRGSVGALTAALLIAFAICPATQAVRGPDQVVAQEKPKAKTPLVGASGSRHAGNKPKASSKDGKPLPLRSSSSPPQSTIRSVPRSFIARKMNRELQRHSKRRLTSTSSRSLSRTRST